MSIKIVLYNPTFSRVLDEVKCFSSAQEATYYRDHSYLAGQPTKLEQDDKPVKINYSIESVEYSDYKPTPKSRQLQQMTTIENSIENVKTLFALLLGLGIVIFLISSCLYLN